MLYRRGRQGSREVATVDSTFSMPGIVWIVSTESAPEVPYLPGVQGVQLYRAKSLKNAVFPSRVVNVLVYLMTFRPFMWISVFTVTKQVLLVCELEHNELYLLKCRF